MQREGLFREMKMRREYEKPSEKRKREKAEGIRRSRKIQRKRRWAEGQSFAQEIKKNTVGYFLRCFCNANGRKSYRPPIRYFAFAA